MIKVLFLILLSLNHFLKPSQALSQAFSGMRSFSWLRGRAMDQRGKWRALLPENDPTKSKGQNLRRPNLSDMCILTLCLFCILFKDRQVGQQFRNTPKLRYNESWYSEFREIVNKCQLPLLLTKSRYSEFRDIVNKRILTRLSVILKFGCIL